MPFHFKVRYYNRSPSRNTYQKLFYAMSKYINCSSNSHCLIVSILPTNSYFFSYYSKDQDNHFWILVLYHMSLVLLINLKIFINSFKTFHRLKIYFLIFYFLHIVSSVNAVVLKFKKFLLQKEFYLYLIRCIVTKHKLRYHNYQLIRHSKIQNFSFLIALTFSKNHLRKPVQLFLVLCCIQLTILILISWCEQNKMFQLNFFYRLLLSIKISIKNIYLIF